MRKQEATEGDIPLRCRPRIKKDKSGRCVGSRKGISMFWNVEGGRGLFIYSADEYTHAHVDSGIFKLTDRGASRSYFKNFCPRPRPRVIWFFRTITLESLNQSEPNFHT